MSQEASVEGFFGIEIKFKFHGFFLYRFHPDPFPLKIKKE